jgi:hypothetical protein
MLLIFQKYRYHGIEDMNDDIIMIAHGADNVDVRVSCAWGIK